MKRTSTLLLSALLLAPACDKQDAAPETAKAEAEATPAPEAKADANVEAEPEADSKALVESGLALGQRFVAFDILNCESGDRYCQVCKFGGSPKIMAVGTLDDPDFQEDLKDLDAIAKKYADKDVKAFAVIAQPTDGKLGTPVADAADVQAKAKALREELGIDMPIVIPAAEGESPNPQWEDHYKVSKSRTIMFADGRNEVKYSQVAPEDFAALDTAIQAVVGS